MSENIVSIRLRIKAAREAMQQMAAARRATREVGTEAKSASKKVVSANAEVASSEKRRANTTVASKKREARANQEVAKSADQSARRIEQANYRIERSAARGGFGRTMVSSFGGGMLSGMGRGLAAYGVMRAGTEGIRALDAQSGLRRMYERQYGKGSAVDMMKRTRALADELGLDAKELNDTGRGLANRLDKETLLKTLRSFATTGAVSGARAEDVSRALVQYKQVAMNGKLQGDELKLMKEAGIDFTTILDRAGLTSRVGSQENPITFEELNAAMIAFAELPENVAAMNEAAKEGSADLMRMSNMLTQDLLPAIGREATPIVKSLADNMKRITPVAVKLVENWELIVGAFVAGKAAQMALSVSSWRTAAALDRLAVSATTASVAQGGGGVGRAAGGFRRPPAGWIRGGTRYTDTLGSASGVRKGLRSAGGAWLARTPWYMRSALTGGASTAAYGASTSVLTAGGIAASAVLAEKFGGVDEGDQIGARWGNAMAGRGFNRNQDVLRKMNAESQKMHDALAAARERKRQYERIWNKKLSNEQYAQLTGDMDIFGFAPNRAAKHDARMAEYERVWQEARARDARLPANSSPRRASVDRANAEAAARSLEGASF